MLKNPSGIVILLIAALTFFFFGIHYANVMLSAAGLIIGFWGLTLLYRTYDEDTVTLVLILSLLFFAGFFHQPVTEGVVSKAVFWIQSVLVVGVTGYYVLKRGARLTRLLIWLVTPFAILYLITGLYSILNGEVLQFVNGARKVMLAPVLLFLGYNLKIEKPTGLLELFFILALGLQIPLSLATNYLYSGLVFEIPQPDWLTGSFGRGGSSGIAIFTAIVPAICLWLYRTKNPDPRRLGLALALGLVVIAVSDIKVTWFLLPVMLVIALLLPSKRKLLKIQRWSLISLFAIFVALHMTAVAISAGSYSKLITGSDAVGQSVSQRAETFVKKYHRTETKGIRTPPTSSLPTAGSLPATSSLPIANRYGTTLIALELTTKDWQHAMFGYGLDSTTYQSLLGTSFVEDEIGYQGLGSQTSNRMLIETGWLGLLLFVAPLIAILFLTFREIYFHRSSNSVNILAGVIFIYGMAMLLSYPYSRFAAYMSTAGAFWLMSGVWLKLKASDGK
jgi:hypothetical protein